MILPQSQSYTAVRLLNDHFCVHAQRVRLFVAGVTGIIGSELLTQLTEAIGDEYDLSVIGVCDKRKHVLGCRRTESAFSEAKAAGQRRSDQLGPDCQNRLITDYPYRTIFVDCTGAREVSGFYTKTAQKPASTLPHSANGPTRHRRPTMMSSWPTPKAKKRTICLKTTAGAGLPVFQTLKDLQRSGDQIQKVTGVLSGTLTFLFDALLDGEPFGKKPSAWPVKWATPNRTPATTCPAKMRPGNCWVFAAVHRHAN